MEGKKMKKTSELVDTSYMVKFCSFIEGENIPDEKKYTLKNLKAKEIKLSTVYQLNDISEFIPSGLDFNIVGEIHESWKDTIKDMAICINKLEEDRKEDINKAMMHFPGLYSVKDRFYEFCKDIEFFGLHKRAPISIKACT